MGTVVFTASANATPASGVTVGTVTVSGEEYQKIAVINASGSQLGHSVASPFHVHLSGAGSALGLSGSPLAVAMDNGVVWVSGSLLTVVTQDISTSAAACTVIIAGCVGFQNRVLAITFTTARKQYVGWISGSTGTSAILQSAMQFSDNGGMDVNRMPHGYLWQTATGSAVVATTTSACNVRGNLNFVRVPG